MIHDLEKQLNPANPGKVEATYQSSISDRTLRAQAEEVANYGGFFSARTWRATSPARTTWSMAAARRTPGAVTSMNRD